MKSIPPPDRNPKKPDYVAPPGACDSHCHIFGPAERFPYAPQRRYTPPDAPKEMLAALHARLGLSRAILVQATPHGTDNRAMLDAIATSEGRWRGVAIVDQDITDRELEELHEGGVRGVRFNFVRHLGGAPDLDAVTGIQARIRPLGWHLVLHLDAEDILTFSEFIRRFTIPFVIDHMGRVDAGHGLEQRPFRLLLELMRNELAWVKISGAERVSSLGPPFADAIPFAQELLYAAPDRVLWGTDFPHPNVKWMPNDGELVDLFAQFTDDEDLRRKVLVDNPSRLCWSATGLERGESAGRPARGVSQSIVRSKRRPVMSAAAHAHHHIPGTLIYDGTQAQKGYALNKMCYSFNDANNRAEFLKDEEAYCRKYGLNEQQRSAIRNRNVTELIAAGGNIYYLAKFAGMFGLDVQDVGAQQTGMTKEAFKAKLVEAGR